MKQVLVFLFLISGISANAQITLEHTFTPISGYASTVLFSSNGTKIIANDTGSYQLKLYNTDYSLWKTITVPGYSGFKYQRALVVSDNLFNSDNSVEFIAFYYSTTTSFLYKAVLVNESGVAVFDLGNNSSFSVEYINGVYKLFAQSSFSTPSLHYATQVYSLPGTMPCGHCGSVGVPKTTRTGAYVSPPIPNPTSGPVTLSYTLPDDIAAAVLTIYNVEGRAVCNYTVSGFEKQLTIDNSKLPSGIYYYVLTAENMQAVSGKMVIAK